MKKMGTKRIEAVAAREETVFVSATCDLCDASETNRPPTSYSGECDWSKGDYEVLYTTVSIWEGYAYPEGGSNEVTAFHVCPRCFKGHLMPFLESFGDPDYREVKPTVYESDY